ncbi:hypothetical protein Sjap_024514 [Stephania japonica]|uniref:Uncharacterized protein n=1 Tax=Stephania japonica TaxID=461633 RepID=A0AAP0EID1_9MAGN
MGCYTLTAIYNCGDYFGLEVIYSNAKSVIVALNAPSTISRDIKKGASISVVARLMGHGDDRYVASFNWWMISLDQENLDHKLKNIPLNENQPNRSATSKMNKALAIKVTAMMVSFVPLKFRFRSLSRNKPTSILTMAVFQDAVQCFGTLSLMAVEV